MAVLPELPREVVENVICRLPSLSFGTARLVCKTWNEFVLSERFAPRSFPEPRAVLIQAREASFADQSLNVYSKSSDRWTEISLPCRGGPRGLLDAHTLVAADGGLLCYRHCRYEQFVIINPVSKKWRVLEPPSFGNLPAKFYGQNRRILENTLVGLHVDVLSGSYALVVAGIHKEHPRATYVYESCREAWRAGAPARLPPAPHGGDWSCAHSDRKSVCKSLRSGLYWLVTCLNSDVLNPLSRAVLRYDVGTDSWGYTRPSEMPPLPSVPDDDEHPLSDFLRDAAQPVLSVLDERLGVIDGDLVVISEETHGGMSGTHGAPSMIPRIVDSGSELLMVMYRRLPSYLTDGRSRGLPARESGANLYFVGLDDLSFVVCPVVRATRPRSLSEWRVLVLEPRTTPYHVTSLLANKSKSDFLDQWWAFAPSLRPRV